MNNAIECQQASGQHKCCDSIKAIEKNCQHNEAKTVATTVKKSEKSQEENVESSLSVMGFGMMGIFIFMLLFFLLIKGLDKAFPGK